MTTAGPERDRALIATIGTRACAIPLQHVAEIMRPLPIEPLAGAPSFVVGVSVVRGAPIPVIDLRALLENGHANPNYGRFVVIKVGERSVAIGVDTVPGIRALDATELQTLPPVLREVPSEYIEAIGTLDAKLLLVLRAARIVPDSVWNALDATKEARG